MSPIPVALATAVVGVIICFFGQRIFRPLLGVLGLLLGAAVGFVVADLVSDDIWVLIGAAAVCALLLGGLFQGLYSIGLMVAGGLALAIPTFTVFSGTGVEAMVTLGATAFAFLLGTLLAWRLQNVMLVLVTAIIGASMIVASGYIFAGNPIPDPSANILINLADGTTQALGVAWVVLVVLGVLVQWRGLGRRR
jgi:hypothetical protein